MFTWLKNLFGKSSAKEPLVLTDPIKYKDEVKVTERPAEPTPTKPKAEQAKPVAEPKKQTKKPAAKSKTKKATIDLDSMSKKDLLAHAKDNGIKANASLKKEEILERIKAG